MNVQMSNNSLYFLHIPKTAGTSVISWLRTVSGMRTCPEGLWSLLLQKDLSEIREYDLYCGHFYGYLDEYLNKRLDTMTFLRNPVDRALSHFRHILRDSQHYFHERVSGHGSFKQFMLDPVTQPLVKNFQVRALSSRFEPWEMWRTAQTALLPRYWLEQYLETHDDGLTTSEALFIAKDALLRCKSFGIVERMVDSAFLIAYALGLEQHQGIERLNVDQGNERLIISRDEWRILVSLLQADMELYEFALRIFDARFCAVFAQTTKGKVL
jgi:hypothetical protein